jgi:hypothetical protein
VLGFKKSKEIPMGDFRWLTVISSNRYPDVELVLEPNANPAAKTFQDAMFKQGIPLTAFEVDDIDADTVALTKKGVQFTMKPDRYRTGQNRDFLRYRGNLIQLYQLKSKNRGS